MANAQLFQWLKENGITQEEAARATGYTLNYLNAVLKGRYPLTPAVTLAFVQAYPATASFLLPASNEETLVSVAS